MKYRQAVKNGLAKELFPLILIKPNKQEVHTNGSNVIHMITQT
jgi:hypothetical protein